MALDLIYFTSHPSLHKYDTDITEFSLELWLRTQVWLSSVSKQHISTAIKAAHFYKTPSSVLPEVILHWVWSTACQS